MRWVGKGIIAGASVVALGSAGVGACVGPEPAVYSPDA